MTPSDRSYSQRWFWAGVANAASAGRRFLTLPFGRRVDRLDQALMRLSWRASEKAHPPYDGIPF